MLKILLAFLIVVQILVVALMIGCLSGISILIPGLGLIVAGELVSVLLLFIEIILFLLSVFLFRRIRRDSEKLV